MSEKQPKLRFEEEKERTATRSPPKKSKVEQSVPKKHKLKQDADKAAEKSQHLRFGKAEITPDEASRMTKQMCIRDRFDTDLLRCPDGTFRHSGSPGCHHVR